MAEAAVLAGRQDACPLSRSHRLEKRKGGAGQQKMGRGMTKEIAVGQQKEGRRLVSLSLAMKEAKQPWTAKEDGLPRPARSSTG